MAAPTVYDQVRYSNYPYALTHPDRLATVAVLRGLRPPDPRNCRVLELGCGAGGNLLAMAVATPGLRAVGIDLAAAPIADGRRAAEEIGIENVDLRQGDVSDLTDGSLGEFDYVIAHGLYAWVPEAVRGDVLAAVQAHLAADGLAYVSYNAYPGGYMRKLLREAGLWFARGEDEPVARAERARELYQFIHEACGDRGDWWGGQINATIEPFAVGPTYRLVHDDLADHWDPLWLADFVERARGAGLEYVGDSDLAFMLPDRVPAQVDEQARELAGGDRVAFEQMLDIVRCVFFRQSILCRDALRPSDTIEPDAMRSLHFASRERARGAVAEEPLRSALELLRGRWPDTLGFAELRAALDADPDVLAGALLDGFRGEFLMPHAAPLRTVAAAGLERPVASPLARWQAQRGTEVTSLAYANVHMEEPAARLLLGLLDGTRDRAAIRAEITERTGLRLSPEDLDANLEHLGRLFLLVAPD
jgi:SAM-dependent methyltransferase